MGRRDKNEDMPSDEAVAELLEPETTSAMPAAEAVEAPKTREPMTRAKAVRLIGNALKSLSADDRSRVLRVIADLHGE